MPFCKVANVCSALVAISFFQLAMLINKITIKRSVIVIQDVVHPVVIWQLYPDLIPLLQSQNPHVTSATCALLTNALPRAA